MRARVLQFDAKELETLLKGVVRFPKKAGNEMKQPHNLENFLKVVGHT